MKFIGSDNNYNKNYFINSYGEVNQRCSTVITTGTYMADRWFVGATANVSGFMSTDIPTGSPSGALSWKFQTGTVTTDVPLMYQHIEGIEFENLWQQYVTVSFWIKAYQTGLYSFVLLSPGDNANIFQNYTINSSGIWEYKKLTFKINPSIGNFNFTEGTIGIKCIWPFGQYTSGHTSTNPNTWENGNFLYDANVIQLGSSTNNYVNIFAPKLELGTVATYNYPIGFIEEIKKCKRFYQKSYDYSTVVGTVTWTDMINSPCFQTGGTISQGFKFNTTMCKTPTSLTLYGSGGNGGYIGDSLAGFDKGSAISNDISKNGARYITHNAITAGGISISYHYLALAEI